MTNVVEYNAMAEVVRETGAEGTLVNFGVFDLILSDHISCILFEPIGSLESDWFIKLTLLRQIKRRRNIFWHENKLKSITITLNRIVMREIEI